MTRATQPMALQARLVFPICAPPRRNGVVTIVGDRIVAVGENRSGGPVVDLGDVAILPGLINPHTHLELSHFAKPLGYAGIPFPDWITEIVCRRRAAAAPDADTVASSQAARTTGLQQCLEYGVTTVGDIVTAEWDAVTWQPFPVTWYAFREMLGHTAEHRTRQREQARRHLQQVTATAGMRAGLSPHAPYTVGRELVAMACRLSSERSVPVAMHLAESREELQLLATGGGPMREMLEHLNVWHADRFPGGCQPRDYLEILASAHRCLAIHGNYLRADDWGYLAQRAERMSVVYCPRTHHYFRHAPYPLADMLGHGVRVVVGTDSLASNPDLNMWEELRFVARAHPHVAPAQILRMGTLDAAVALGCQDEIGSLEPGKRADLTFIRIEAPPTADPCDALLHGNGTVHSTICGGRFTFQSGLNT
ncbi:MAG: amidohydrolase family protein [Pirellulaceae bacterium]